MVALLSLVTLSSILHTKSFSNWFPLCCDFCADVTQTKKCSFISVKSKLFMYERTLNAHSSLADVARYIDGHFTLHFVVAVVSEVVTRESDGIVPASELEICRCSLPQVLVFCTEAWTHTLLFLSVILIPTVVNVSSCVLQW